MDFSGTYPDSAGGSNAWSGWPNVSHQEPTYPSQASALPVSSGSENNFVADPQLYYPPPAAPQPTDLSSFPFGLGPSVSSLPDLPDFVFNLCAYALVCPVTMTRVHMGQAGDDDFVAMGHAISSANPESRSPAQDKACSSLARKVYRHVQGTFVRWYASWKPSTSQLNRSTLPQQVAELQAEARRRETPANMPWKVQAVDALATSPRFWGYVDRPEGFAWTEDSVYPEEVTGGGYRKERLAATSRDVKPPADAGSSSSTNHPFSQNGSGITYPTLHGTMNQIERDVNPRSTLSANASASQPAPSQQRPVNAWLRHAGFGNRFSAPRQGLRGPSFQTSAPGGPLNAPGIQRHHSFPTDPSVVSLPSLASGVGVSIPAPSATDVTEDIWTLVEQSRWMFDSGMISESSYAQTVMIAFQYLAQTVGYFSTTFPPSDLNLPPPS